MTQKNTISSVAKEVKICVPWGHISGKLWNENASKKVVCLHGWLDNANSFDPLIPLLSQDYSYLAIDLPGHGKSSHLPPGSIYYFANWVYDVFLVLKNFNWDEKVSLVGHSMGAGIAILFATSFPELVDKVISLDIVAPYVTPINHCPGIIKQSFRSHFEYDNNTTIGNKPYTYDSAIKRLLEFQSLNENSAKIMLERGMTKSLDDSNTYIMNRDIRLHYRAPMYYSDEHWQSIIQKMESPLLVIIGIDSHIKGEIISLKRYEEYKNSFKNILKTKFMYKEYPGTHHLHMNTPELISQDITAFLNTPSL